MIKLNNFRDELTDISAEKEALLHRHVALSHDAVCYIRTLNLKQRALTHTVVAFCSRWYSAIRIKLVPKIAFACIFTGQMVYGI